MTQSYPASRGKTRAIASTRDYIFTRYVAASGGHEPEVPDLCPVALDDADRRGTSVCSISLDHYRARKTGPPFCVAVFRCSSHRAGFTVYPPGFGPYLRQPVEQVDLSAELADPTQDPVRIDLAPSDPARFFQGTLFEAAFDSAIGVAWARDSVTAVAGRVEVPDRWWPTQCRRLDLGIQILGLSPGTGVDQRARIGELLGISAAHLRELGKDLIGYRAKGEAVRSVLLRLRPGVARILDLLTCFHLAGRLGRPRAWSARHGFLPRRAFPSIAMTGGS